MTTATARHILVDTKEKCEELKAQIGSLYQASKDLVGDFSLETLLSRIVRLAQAQVQAEYAALAIRDENGAVTKFIHSGMSEEELHLMPHPPVGKGLLGELQHKHSVIRIPEIQSDPRSGGFPPSVAHALNSCPRSPSREMALG